MTSSFNALTEKQKTIIKTIIFFDIFSHPLSIYELWRYLSKKISFIELEKELNYLIDNFHLGELNGFYFLPDRQNLVNIRRDRYHYSNRKFSKALFFIKLFKLIPGIKFVALSNLIGRHNLRDESDIDIFIITKKNRIWTSRLFCAGLMKILGQRPTPENKKDKICLSFYIDEAHLDLSGVVAGEEDYYFYFWLAGLYSLYDKQNYHYQLMLANSWLKDYLPNGNFFLGNESYRESSSYYLNKKKEKKPNHSLSRLGDYLEILAKKFQLRIMPQALKSKANQGKQVIISPGILKLFLIDRREEFTKLYKERLEHLSNAN